MANKRRSFPVFIVIGLMVVLASYFMLNNSSTFIRRWEMKKLACGSVGKVKATLTTTRMHDPNSSKEGQQYDDLQLDLLLAPLEDKFSPECLQFLETQRKGHKHPVVWLIDSRHHLLSVDPVEIEMEPQRKDGGVAAYRAHASTSVFPDKLRTADDWHLEWQPDESEE